MASSCRTCGGEQEPAKSCPACKETVQWKCVACNKETDISVHTHYDKIIAPSDVMAAPEETTTGAVAAVT